MVRNIFLILVFLGYTVATQAAIIFVHLGPIIPQHIYVSLEQARLFNPNQEICLIANQQAFHTSPYNFETHSFTKILAESLKRSEEHEAFLRRCPHSDVVYGGFWRKAIERFFYIHEYMTVYNLTQVVHLESDVMLYVDLDDIKDALSHYKGIGAVFDCDTRCIPSFVYISNTQAIHGLVSFIAARATQNMFDMGFLALYRNSVSQEQIDNLPLIMPEYTAQYPLINDLHQTSVRPEAYTQKSNQFHSIFDGAAIGQYLGGRDPIHFAPEPGFINETCLFNPSKLQFEWRKDEKGRNIPFALCNETAYRINNLHIHSKRLHEFRS